MKLFIHHGKNPKRCHRLGRSTGPARRNCALEPVEDEVENELEVVMAMTSFGVIPKVSDEERKLVRRKTLVEPRCLDGLGLDKESESDLLLREALDVHDERMESAVGDVVWQAR